MKGCKFFSVVAAAALAALVLASPASAWYPITTQVELGTATWCGYCFYAYQGIEANKGRYDTNEFNAIRYYSTSGGLGCPDSDARIAYYSITGYPTAVFNGTVRSVGASAETGTGEPYRAIIESLLDDPAYYKLTVDYADFSAPSGSVHVTIEVMEDVPAGGNMVLRMSLREDNVPWSDEEEQDVNRDMLPEVTVDVDEVGETQEVGMSFDIDPSWNTDNLKLLAFIQDDVDKKVHASASSDPNPDYSLRYYALGERQVVGPVQGIYAFDFFRVYNTGNLTDHYTVTVEIDGPADWVAMLCDDQMCYGPSFDTDLAPGEFFDLKVEVTPISTGFGQITVRMTQDNHPYAEGRTLHYTYITEGMDVLLVDDDSYESYENYFTDAIDYSGYTYAIWDRNTGPVSSDVLSEFPIVVWNLGWAFPTLDEQDRAALGTFLDNGGYLFITGQDLGWEMHDIGGDAYQWYQDYLHAIFINDDTNDYTLNGVPGDPISDGLDIVIAGGDGANNQEFPSDIDPADGSASVIWTYDAYRNGAIKAETDVYRVVYMAFGYEAINNADDRHMVMSRVLNWLTNGSTAADEPGSLYRPFLAISPNPVSPGTVLRFTLPEAGKATLGMYTLDGRLVETLVSGNLDAGTHTLKLADASLDFPAGVYYYRLTAPGVELSRKAVLLR